MIKALDVLRSSCLNNKLFFTVREHIISNFKISFNVERNSVMVA